MRREQVPLPITIVIALAVAQSFVSAAWLHVVLVLAILAMIVPVGLAIARSER